MRVNKEQLVLMVGDDDDDGDLIGSNARLRRLEITVKKPKKKPMD